jgi:hypothetical protein
MHAAERERLLQAYNAGDSSKAVPICGGCLAVLVLVVVLGSPRADEYAHANRPTPMATASEKRISVSEQPRQHTFEVRRVAFVQNHP